MSKRSRLDLLVRVRYLNPLPAPPFPPKMFDITTDISRLGEPSYLSQLATSTPLPMLVDSEMGMHLELSHFDGVWDGDDSAINSVEHTMADIDAMDAVLLAPLANISTANGVERTVNNTSDVSWMRTSNLFAKKTQNRRKDAGEATKDDMDEDDSELAQIMSIDRTFTDMHTQSMEDVRHPDSSKKHLKVVESFDILPDDVTFTDDYCMLRFPERPTALTAAMSTADRPSSPRLRRALLDPHGDNALRTLEYYLPAEDDLNRLDEVFERAVGEDVVGQVESLAAEGDETAIDQILPNTVYNHARSYEMVSGTKPDKELLLCISDQEKPDKKRKRGVYYQNLGRRMLLRKSRAKRKGEEEDEERHAWSNARVGYRVLNEEEKQGKEDASGSINDPDWARQEIERSQGGYNEMEALGEAIDDDT